nr:SatD family protein [Clostridium gasigenes]
MISNIHGGKTVNIYSVINIDLVKSRKIENRIEIQCKIKEYFLKLNNKYDNLLVSPITFILGDEWQIVIRDVKESYNIFTEIKLFLHLSKLDCYCGIGIGTISTNESNDTREMDGDAFIYAREAINIAKKSNRFYNEVIHTKDCKLVLKGNHIDMTRNHNNQLLVNESDTLLECAVTSTEDDNISLGLIDIINNIMQNNEMIENKFTDKQIDIISLYEELGSYSNIEKEYPNYTKSGISNKLSASNYFLTIYNKKVISKLLDIYAYTLGGEYCGY